MARDALAPAREREEDVTVVSESKTRGGGSMDVYRTPFAVVMICEHNDVRIVCGGMVFFATKWIYQNKQL